MYIYMYTYTCICIYRCIYLHTHTQARTHRHTHAQEMQERARELAGVCEAVVAASERFRQADLRLVLADIYMYIYVDR